MSEPPPSAKPDDATDGDPTSLLGDWLEARMLDRRVVWIRGRLDDGAATLAATQLMTLDATGDDPVRLHLNSGEGTLTAALTLMDTIAALGVPVEAICVGSAEGPALGVLAVAPRRAAAAHARLRLMDAPLEASGSGPELTTQLEQHRRLLDRFVELVAAACRQPAERVEVDLAAGRFFDAEEALAYRLVDAVWRGDPAT